MFLLVRLPEGDHERPRDTRRIAVLMIWLHIATLAGGVYFLYLR